jgi:hypothetical protein
MKDFITNLTNLGIEFECELFLPPFNNSTNPFYKIEEIKDDALKFKDFLVSLRNTGAKFSSHIIDNEAFLEIEINKEEIEEIKGVEYVV